MQARITGPIPELFNSRNDVVFIPGYHKGFSILANFVNLVTGHFSSIIIAGDLNRCQELNFIVKCLLL
jgi:hypothetical protein